VITEIYMTKTPLGVSVGDLENRSFYREKRQKHAQNSQKLPKRLVNNFFLLTFADPIELTSVRL